MSLIDFGWFSTHSKFQLPWKVDCDALTEEDIESLAKLIQWKFAFGEVLGLPRGGLRLAEALKPHVTEGYPTLIVDDVLTTGNSMNHFRAVEQNPDWPEQPFTGVVIFARGLCPNWVWPIFTVNEWAQSRATGLG